jgi:hypothetical protein
MRTPQLRRLPEMRLPPPHQAEVIRRKVERKDKSAKRHVSERGEPHLETRPQIYTLHSAVIVPSFSENATKHNEENGHHPDEIRSMHERQVCTPVNPNYLGTGSASDTI